MPDYQARYFDGQRPIAHVVHLRAHVEGLTIFHDNGPMERWRRDDIVARGDVNDESVLRLTLRQTPQVQLVLEERAAIAALMKAMPGLRRHAGHRRSIRSWIGLAAGAAGVVAAILLAVDRLPGWAAPLVPAAWESWLGDRIITAMAQQGSVCEGVAGRAALDHLARRLTAGAGLETPVTVRVLDWKMVNAFAVPGGQIAVFRGLIEEAESPDEVAGVLAHEVGHVLHHHPTEGVLRQLGLAATLKLLVGGSGTGVEDMVGLGNTLLTLSYGRDAEREADASAIAILGKADMDARGLFRFFDRLERDGNATAIVPAVLLTHPPTAERLAATADAPAGAPALDDTQWRALRAICE